MTPHPEETQSTPISIIIPFYNEEENVEAVLKEARQTNPQAEIIAVDDGSTDSTAAKIRAFPDVRLISMPKNIGQSAALYTGLVNASRDLCVLMDGDGQSDPADIPSLLRESDKYDVVCGYRRKRKDDWQIKVASHIANRVRKLFTGDCIRDAGCTLKILQKEHIRFLIPFNENAMLHGGMPAKCRIENRRTSVNHRPRKFGRSKYNAFCDGRGVGMWI